MLLRSSGLLVADIGASHVACGVFTLARSGRLRLEEFTMVGHTGDVDATTWTDETAKALRKIALDNRFRGNLAIAVPGHLALTKFIKTPAIARSQRSKIIGFEAAQNIPYPLGDVVWDHQLVAEDKLNLEVVLTAAKTEAMFGLCAAVNSAGYPVTSATPASIALHDAFRFSYPDVKESVLIVDVGARSTHVLYLEAARFCARTLPYGGNAVTQSLADELAIDFASVEKLKLELLTEGGEQLSDSIPGRAVQQASSRFCAKLQAEITRSMVNLRRETSGAEPATLFLAGGASQIENLDRVLSEKLRVRVQRLDPLREVELSPDARASGAARSAAFLPPLVGLATRLAVKNRRTADLLPPVIRNELAFRRRQPVVVAAAALLLVAMVPPIRHFQSQATAAQGQATQLGAQLQPLQQLEKRNADLRQQIDDVSRSVAALESVVEKKTSWLNFFQDLQNRLVTVEDVWLESIAIVHDQPPEIVVPGIRGTAPADLRLVLSGRLLDRSNPVSKVSPDSYERVKQLIASVNGSEFVASVERERFDNSQPGILRFNFVLAVSPQKPL